jgi:hypothetical protein
MDIGCILATSDCIDRQAITVIDLGNPQLGCGQSENRPIRYVEKKTCEVAVPAVRTADFPSTIGAALAEIGFTVES